METSTSMQNTSDTNSVSPPILQDANLNEYQQYTPGEIIIDEHGQLYKKFLEEEGVFGFLTKTFDNWISKILPHQLRSKQIKINDSTIYFDNPLLEKPMLSVSGQSPQVMWPEVARRRYLDYSGALYADLVQIDDKGKEINRAEKVFICMIPIPIGSEFDNLYGLDDVELLAKGEIPKGPKGYFITKGSERVILLHEKLASMKNFIYNGKIPGTNNNAVVSTITVETIKGSSVITIVRNKNNTLHLYFSSLGKNNSINVLSVFKIFGIDNPDDILKFIIKFTREEWASKVLGKLNASYLEFKEIGDIVTYISTIKSISNKDPYEERQKKIIDSFRNELFPQIDSDPNQDNRRISMLALMTVKLLEYMAGFRNLDSRDDWSNKRLDPASESLRQLFQSSFNMTMDELEEEIIKNKYTQIGTIAQKFKSGSMTKIFLNSISSNNFGIKGIYSKNIVDTLRADNLLEAYSHITRIRVTGQEMSHNTKPREVQVTACGFICPVETPEREGCGTVKNISIMTILTSYDPDTDIIIIEFSKKFLKDNKTSYYDSKCWFNGVFLGWCPGQDLKKALIESRRKSELPVQMSVVLDPDNILHINTTASRLIRPLLIVNTETRNLVIDEKNLWDADFNTLLIEGAVEYVDAFEQNVNCYIAETIWQMDEILKMISDNYTSLVRYYARKAILTKDNKLPQEIEDIITQEEFEYYLEEQNNNKNTLKDIDNYINLSNQTLTALLDKATWTHCELDPIAIWGAAASTIPLPNHSYGPRLTFQAKMGNQSVGIYHPQQRYRFPTTTKRLANPTRSLFETETVSDFALRDNPTGTAAIIALIADAANQEDSFIINEGSLQRGLFRYVKEFSVSAVESKEKDVEEFISRPEIRPNEPKERYANLDERGIVRVGSVINPRDAIIGMRRRNIKTGQVENATIFASENEHGIVEEVLITESREGRTIVSVKLRDTRIPQRGDKFALRPSQKGTLGIIRPEVDMPVSLKGVKPDIIMNPLAFPSRMTLGTLIEILAGKEAALTGSRKNATAFRDANLENTMTLLQALGYQRKGDEVFINGETGEMFTSLIFSGVAYIQKLKHDVEDKIQARGKGRTDPRTMQPVRGRASGGGQRFGEMEGWAMMSHGAAGVLQERLCTSSDATQVVFCATCGTIAIANHVDKTYECRLCESRGAAANFVRGTIPYVQKLANQLIAGMNTNMIYRFRNVEK